MHQAHAGTQLEPAEGGRVSREASHKQRDTSLMKKEVLTKEKRDCTFVGQLIKPSGNTFTEDTEKQIS